MNFEVGDDIIIFTPDDSCYLMKGRILSIQSIDVYKVKWEDGTTIDHSSLSHFCRKLTKLEKALK